MQAGEQLTLGLVDPLHLHLKDGVWVHLHLSLLLQEGGELQLVLLRTETQPGQTDRQTQTDRCVTPV